MTGQHIASQFKLICSEYGWPETIVSDNGPCYTSEIFTNLMIEYNVNHITSLPHYLQSNGLAEKYVQIVKNLFYKAKEEGKDLYKCLMVYCNTPSSSNLQSPMQILASRSAISNLPMSNAARRQKGLDCKHLRTHLTYTWTKQSCTKTLMTKDGIQPLLPDCVKNQEVT